MKILSAIALTSAATVFVLATADAADVRTPLACTLGGPSGNGFALALKNTTGRTLPTETIINVDVKWTKPGMPGDVVECFAITAPLAPGAQVPHVTKLDRDQNPLSCMAFVSSLHPAVVHENGASETDCD